MKKITLLLAFFAVFAWQSNAQTCTQTFTVAGNDSDPTVLTINAADVDCYGTGNVASMQLVNAADNLTSGYCSTDGTSWYGFNLSIDGGASVPVCGDEINLTDISGFTTLTITSQDNDNYTDGISITIDVEVTFTYTAAPECTTLVSPANGDTFAPTTGDLTWAAAVGGTDGYYLTVGTTTGGDEVLATMDVGNVTTYNVGALAQGTTYYVSILPFNSFGDATGCTEESFTTFTPPANDDCDAAIALTVNEAFSCDDATTGTILGASDSGVSDNGAGTPNDDVWFSFVATEETHTVKMVNVAGTYLDLVHEVMEGTCDALVSLNVSDPNSSLIEGLTIGNTYFVRVFGYSSTADRDTTFDVCVGVIPPPPANDLCADAIALTVGGAIDENVVTTHNVGATDSGETAPGCGNYQGGDVWFTAVVPFTGAITFETIRNEGSSLSDTGAAVYSGDCGALVLVECNDDDSDDGAFSKVALTGQTPGDVLYFRAWEYGNNMFDAFSVVAYDPTPVDYQTECVDGQDQDAFQLIFNAADITVNQGTAISAVFIENFVSHYSTPDGTTTWCPDWYYFTLNVDGADVVVDGCAADINGTDITGFSTATITITDADDYNDHVYICGDLKVYHEEVACPMPMDLTATDITVDSANLGWTTDGEEAMWNIEYGEADFVLGEGTLIGSVDTNPYALTGLTAGTTYEFYVQADCDPDMSTWVGPFAFTTSPTPPEVGCGIYNFGTLENGSSNPAHLNRVIAHDIVVGTGFDMSVSKIVPNIFMSPGVTGIANVYFYEDNAGTPGAIVASIMDITPTTSVVLGSNFGFDVSALELDFPTVVLAGSATEDTTYWIGVAIATSDESNCFWENTTTSLVGLGQAYDDGAAGFVVDPLVEGVYAFYGSCSTIGIADATIDGFGMYPNPVQNTLTINATNSIDIVTVYNLLGQEVLVNTPSATEVQMDMTNLPTGAYIVKVQAGEQVGSYNLIKQ